MGEGCGNDADLMDFVSSVNIACGFHAGDAATMRETLETAISKGIAIGAHPGYRDRENFGRVSMSLSPDEVYDIVVEQITDLRDICKSAGGKLRHVKAHGALYNQAAKDAKLSHAIAMAVRAVDDTLILFGLSGSVMIGETERCGLRSASEVFADRTYRSDGSLTPRIEANALIVETDAAVAQVLQMVRDRTVTATDGSIVPITADTICIHGDGKNSLEFARTIQQKLVENGVEIGPV